MSDPSTLEEATRKTYRYLRVAIVGMVALLAVSVVIELVWGDVGQLGSISAYYYTPVRAIFVGALMAVGLSLIAIRGRDGAEDTLLNLAGMLAPVVALVPTPLSRTNAEGGAERYLPDEFLPSVENNLSALLVLGALGLGFAAWTAHRNQRGRRAAMVGVLVGGAGFVGFAVWFAAGRDSFVVGAHYVAAVPLFLCISAVALINARAAKAMEDDRPAVQMLPAERRAVLYQLIAYAMVATLVVAGILFALQAAESTPVDHWLFYVETVLLALFVTFWLLQTAEYWEEGIPEEVAAAG
ncbi:MAG: hypothetical protein M3237_14655 [Actinomycetota bacterium]|nr:hypothetical protein [Actinomycetota bacterium]